MDSNILNQDLKDCINALQHGQNVYMTRGKGLYDRRELIRTLIRGLPNINILIIASNAEDVQRIKTGNGGIEYINSQGLSDIELSNVDFVTYRELVVSKDLSRLNKKYRLIIFNECHRIGGGDTKVKVEELLKNNIGVPRIGITTLEEGRADNIDIEKLYFTGTRLSDYGLKQAIYNKNITEFNYVVGTTDDALKAYIRNNCKEDVDEVTKNIFNVINSKEILLKHINNVFGCIPNTMKIIGFCASDSQENLGAVTLLNMLKSAFPEHELLKYNRFNKNETGSKQIQYVINPNLEKDLRFTPDIVIILNKTSSSRLIARYISTALRFNSTSTALIFDFLNNIQSKTDKRNAGTGNDHADSVKKNLIDYGVQVNNIVVHDEMKNAMDFIDKNRMDRKKAFMEQMMALREKKLLEQASVKKREQEGAERERQDRAERKNRIAQSEERRLTWQAADQERILGLPDGSHLPLQERLNIIKRENIRRNTEAKQIRIEEANRRREEAERRRIEAEEIRKQEIERIVEEEKLLGITEDRSNLSIVYRRKLLDKDREIIERKKEELRKKAELEKKLREVEEDEKELGIEARPDLSLDDRVDRVVTTRRKYKEEEQRRKEAEQRRKDTEEMCSNPIYMETYTSIIDKWNNSHDKYEVINKLTETDIAETDMAETDTNKDGCLYKAYIGNKTYEVNKKYIKVLSVKHGGCIKDPNVMIKIGGSMIRDVEKLLYDIIGSKKSEENIYDTVRELRIMLEAYEIYKNVIYFICNAYYYINRLNKEYPLKSCIDLFGQDCAVYSGYDDEAIAVVGRICNNRFTDTTFPKMLQVLAICDGIKMILKTILDVIGVDNLNDYMKFEYSVISINMRFVLYAELKKYTGENKRASVAYMENIIEYYNSLNQGGV